MSHRRVPARVRPVTYSGHSRTEKRQFDARWIVGITAANAKIARMVVRTMGYPVSEANMYPFIEAPTNVGENAAGGAPRSILP